MRRAIRSLVDNPLPAHAAPYAAIIGDHPSRYSKSPTVWNAALRELGLPARYLPLDVSPADLPALVEALRADPGFAGGNVTVPHKVAVLPLLDAFDEPAARIGAVNTIARTAEGGLKGFNTDAPAGREALTSSFPGQTEAFLPDLRGSTVLLLGAGGAARALAFALAEGLGPDGTLLVFNRHEGRAVDLANAVNAHHRNARPARGSELASAAARSDLIVNATSVGQRGAGSGVDQEPFSPLGPVPSPGDAPKGDGLQTAIRLNNEASLRLLQQVPVQARIWDIIYAPPDTTLLRQARDTGHRTLNGKSMLVIQAALSFHRHVFAAALAERGLSSEEAYQRVLEIMAREW